MSFDQTNIEAKGYREGISLVVEWISAAPDGTVFQIYGRRRLIWAGTSRRAVLPLLDGLSTIDVGAVAAGESTTDFSASLPAAPADRARLSWQGGSYLSPTISAFRIYSGTVAGGTVIYGNPIATVPAYAAAIVTDGYGQGGYGQGGYGHAAASYGWTSGPLASGTWAFGIVPVDSAQNEGTAMETSVVIAAPPRPPAADADGMRLHHSYDDETFEVTLTWAASPA